MLGSVKKSRGMSHHSFRLYGETPGSLKKTASRVRCKCGMLDAERTGELGPCGSVPAPRQAFTHAAAKYFPEGSKLTRPEGGYLLWCELPKEVNSDKVFRAALAKNILITPGSIFGTDKKFSHHMRLNAGVLWSSYAV